MSVTNLSRCEIKPEFILLVSLCYLFFDAEATAAIFMSAAVHEAGHMLMIHLLGGKIEKVSFGGSGLELKYSGSDSSVEGFFFALGGPMFGVLLMAAVRNYVEVNSFAAQLWNMSFVLNAWNLLPILPLDGGKMIYYLLSLLVSYETAYKICTLLFWTVVGILVFGTVLLLLYAKSFILLPAVCSLVIYGCKMSVSGVKSI